MRSTLNAVRLLLKKVTILKNELETEGNFFKLIEHFKN
jgi:hypothetical protein